eukprot:GHVU01231538.1.p1 GENE.GHVU01231538.1~~GHVU01231538.1.p1  ORF type:complete len:171 (-),score=15.83 GHVU01231538.1:305-817(-)
MSTMRANERVRGRISRHALLHSWHIRVAARPALLPAHLCIASSQPLNAPPPLVHSTHIFTHLLIRSFVRWFSGRITLPSTCVPTYGSQADDFAALVDLPVDLHGDFACGDDDEGHRPVPLPRLSVAAHIPPVRGHRSRKPHQHQHQHPQHPQHPQQQSQQHQQMQTRRRG